MRLYRWERDFDNRKSNTLQHSTSLYVIHKPYLIPSVSMDPGGVVPLPCMLT